MKKKILKAIGYKLKADAGFTLLESLVVVSLLALFAFSALGGLRGVRARGDLRDGQASLVRALENARSRAATGVGFADHGVAITGGDQITSFDGSSTTTTVLPPFVSSNPAAVTIIFDRLSALTNASTTIVLSNSSGTASVAVTYDGAIIPK